jgi:hypothetical protein
MAFDQTTRNRLQRFVNDARRVLEEEFTRQLQNDYGMDPNTGSVADLSSLRHINDAQRETARILRDTLAHYTASGDMNASQGLDRIVREQAFTVLNRLAALRMAESRGLLVESVGNGFQAKGYQLYARLAGTGLGETGDAYRVYLFSVFDELAQDLPGLFDRYSPQGRLFPREAALLQVLNLINDADIAPLWGEDETIGWIYQYFNSKEERKAMREASQAPRNSRELAVRNQFFTPRYVVEFLVDNTLGRLWFNATGGATHLRERCQYLLVKPDETPQAATKLRDPRTLKLLDPACGSMHFGLYAFDLFAEIYQESWTWEQQHGPGSLDVSTQPQAAFKPLSQTYEDEASFLHDVPRLIIEHNIYGVDIDPRAAQIASLALWLRAQRAWHDASVKAKDRPLIGRGHVVAAVAPPAERDLRQQFAANLDQRDAELFEKTLQMLKGLPELGVLLQVERELPRLVRQVYVGKGTGLFAEQEQQTWQQAALRLRTALTDFSEAAKSTYQGRLYASDALQGLRLIELCHEAFDVVVMNPPFGALPAQPKADLVKHYPKASNDLLSIFVDRGLDLLRPNGRLGAITSRACFFAVSFSDWRKTTLIETSSLEAFLDLGQGVMDDAMVEAATYVLTKASHQHGATVIRAITDNEKQTTALKCASAYRRGAEDIRLYRVDREIFNFLPNSPFAYWADKAILNKLARWSSFEPSLGEVRKGLRTGDNFRFTRALWEINSEAFTPEVVSSASNERRQLANWAPLVLSGASQPWYSPIIVAINWKNNGRELRQYVTKYGTPSRLIQAEDYYFRPGMSWTLRAKRFIPYIIPGGCIPTGSRPMAFPVEGMEIQGIALSASRIASAFLRFYGEKFEFPKFLEGKLKLLPCPTLDSSLAESLSKHVMEQWSRRRLAYQGHEPFFDFIKPFGLTEIGANTEIDTDLSTFLGDALETRISEAYGLTRAEAGALCSDLDDVLRVSGASVDDGGDDEDEDDDPELLLDTSDRSRYEGYVSYAIGCAFGRWDIRFATGTRTPAVASNPFQPMPKFPPGQLQPDDRKQLIRRDLDISDSGSRENYPIAISPRGILVDDPSHSDNTLGGIREVFSVIFPAISGARSYEHLEQNACDAIGVRSLEDYLRRPNGFFFDHLKRYTKSRRRAPIYWPIATVSSSYVLWIYYPSVTSQTLYMAINDFVEPKLRQVGGDVSELRNKGSARTRDDERQFEVLQSFELELIELRDTLLKLAPGYKPSHDDGVQISAAPLWPLFRHKPWQKVLKDTWTKLEKGDYDWAHLAMNYWPDRVREKCKTDKSLAIAHGLEHLYVEPEAQPKKPRGRKKAGGDE